MPTFLSVACADTYGTAATLDSVFGSPGGSFVVGGADALYSLATGTQGAEQWSEDLPAPVGTGFISPGACGVQFKNAVAGSVATVSATLAWPGKPVVQLGASGVSVPPAVTTLPYQTTLLAAPVAMASANTWYAGPSLALAAGTWLCNAWVVLLRAGGAAGFSARMFTPGVGTNVRAEHYQATANEPVTIALSWIFALSVAGTVEVDVASTGATSTLLATIPDAPAPNPATATGLIAVQIG